MGIKKLFPSQISETIKQRRKNARQSLALESDTTRTHTHKQYAFC